MFRYRSVSVAGFVFQACSFIRLRSRSEISELRRDVAPKRLRREGGQPLGHLSVFRINRLRAVEHLIIAHASSVAMSTSITFRISSFRESAASSLLELCQTLESCRITSSNRRAFVLRGLAPRLISWQRPPQAPSASFAIPLHPYICRSPRRQ